MIHTHTGFFRACAAYAAARPQYMRRDSDRDAAAYRVLLAMVRQLVAGGTVRMVDVSLLVRVIVSVDSNVASTTAARSRLVVFGGGIDSTVLEIEQKIAVELYAKLLYATAECPRSLAVPWFLARAGAAVYPGVGHVHAFVNELMKMNEAARWLSRLVDVPLLETGVAVARELAAVAGPAAAVASLTADDRRRAGALHVTSLPTAVAYDGAVRAAIVVRLFAEYALARDVAESFDHAAPTPFDDDDGAEAPETLGRRYATANIVEVAERFRREQHRLIGAGSTPALADSCDGDARVQRYFERVVLAAAVLRRRHHDAAEQQQLFTQHAMAIGSAAGRRLFRMSARLYNLLAATDARTSTAMIVDQCRMLAQEARINDIAVAQALVVHCFDVPLVLRHCHYVARRDRVKRTRADGAAAAAASFQLDCTTRRGSAYGVAMARQFAMPLQVDAIELLTRRVAAANVDDQLCVVSVVPAPPTATHPPTPQQLAASVRNVVPDALEGRDFVVVWSPDDAERRALVMSTSMWSTVRFVGYADIMVRVARYRAERRTSASMNQCAGDAVALVFAEYARARLGAHDAAVALNLLRTLLGGGDGSAAAATAVVVVDDDEVDASIRRVERVVEACGGTTVVEFVDALASPTDSPSLVNAIRTALEPRAECVWLAMPPRHGRSMASGWMAANDATRHLWSEFFGAPDTDGNHLTCAVRYAYDRNRQLGVERPIRQYFNAQRLTVDKDDVDERSATKRQRRTDAAATTPTSTSFHSVVVANVPFRASECGHSSEWGNDAVFRSADPQRVVHTYDGRLHLNVIDAILTHSDNARRWLGDLVVVASNERATSGCVRVPRAKRALASRSADDDDDDDDDDDEPSLSVAVAASIEPLNVNQLEVLCGEHKLTIVVVARLIGVVMDALDALPTHVVDAGQRRAAARRAAWSLLNKSSSSSSSLDPSPSLATGIAVVASELAADALAHNVPSSTALLMTNGVPRPLAFAQPSLLGGALTNFFHSVGATTRR